MIKRCIVAIMLVLMCCLAACVTTNEVESTVPEEVAPPSMFVVVEHTTAWRVVYHRDTKVMYACSSSSYNIGNFTLLVNADGTPMIYNG